MDKVKYLKKFGDRVRHARNQLRMSQEDVAIACGYKGRGTISKIEVGGSDMPLTAIEVLAKVLKTTPIALIWGDMVATDYASDRARLAFLFDGLNAVGRARALETLEEMSELPKYTEVKRGVAVA
jgi:transcriptional regulator with XRE-family HTH domain